MLLLATTLLVLSSPTVELHGTVLAEGKEPVTGATVFTLSSAATPVPGTN